MKPSNLKRRRLLLGGALLLLALFWLPPLPPALRSPAEGRSLTLEDRHGRPLRQLLGSHQGVDRFLPYDQLPPLLVRAFLVSEDKRFFWHPGVDPVAVARAAWSNLRHQERISGGSSLTQQLVRNLLGNHQRSWRNKFRESYYALRLEATHSKKEILELYLNRVPFGNQMFGVQAAAHGYFGRDVDQLSVKQMAALAVLIRSPSTLDPFFEDGKSDLEKLANRLVEQLEQESLISALEMKVALDEELVLDPDPDRFQAPHFCDWVLDRKGNEPQVRTTVDLELQNQVEDIVQNHLASLKKKEVSQAAVVVLAVESGEVLAMVGSKDFFDFRHQGQFNAALAPRQPGSSLKPFTYGLALEHGWNPATLLPDINLYPNDRGESFIPKNYDGRYHGPVSLRAALACSYNVPAVRALELVGVDALLWRLRELGMEYLDEDPQFYGLGLTLGDGEVTLLELANAYRTLARGGLWSPVRGYLKEPETKSEQRMDPVACHLLVDILDDESARIPAFTDNNPLHLPFPCAAKTGTSKGYRDNWCVGFTPEHVVAVWVGNFDGRPMVNVSGITGAGPLFHEVMMLMGDGGDFVAPKGVVAERVCAVSGELAGEHCPNRKHEVFDARYPPTEECTVHQMFTIDRRDGRVATESTPARYRQQRLFTVFDPLYRNWMVAAGLPLPPQKASAGAACRLAFPQDGSIFKRDPVLRGQYQRVVFQAVVPPQATSVEWWVDGRLSATTRHPSFDWQLVPGEHQVRVKAGGMESRPIHLVVY